MAAMLNPIVPEEKAEKEAGGANQSERKGPRSIQF